MEQGENEFYDDQEEEQEHNPEDLWNDFRGHFIDPRTGQPLNGPPPSQSRFARRTEPPPVEPEQSETVKEGKPRFVSMEERARRYQERKRLQEAEAPEEKSPEPEQPELKEESQRLRKAKTKDVLPDLPDSLFDT